MDSDMVSNITKNHKVGMFAILIASALMLGGRQAGRQPPFHPLALHLRQIPVHGNEAIRTNQANIGSQGREKKIQMMVEYKKPNNHKLANREGSSCTNGGDPVASSLVVTA